MVGSKTWVPKQVPVAHMLRAHQKFPRPTQAELERKYLGIAGQRLPFSVLGTDSFY